jgi:hypothetical protein
MYYKILNYLTKKSFQLHTFNLKGCFEENMKNLKSSMLFFIQFFFFFFLYFSWLFVTRNQYLPFDRPAALGYIR